MFDASADSDYRVEKGKSAIDVERRALQPDNFIFFEKCVPFSRQRLYVERGSPSDEQSHFLVDFAPSCVPVAGETLPEVLGLANV